MASSRTSVVSVGNGAIDWIEPSVPLAYAFILWRMKIEELPSSNQVFGMRDDRYFDRADGASYLENVVPNNVEGHVLSIPQSNLDAIPTAARARYFAMACVRLFEECLGLVSAEFRKGKQKKRQSIYADWATGRLLPVAEAQLATDGSATVAFLDHFSLPLLQRKGFLDLVRVRPAKSEIAVINNSLAAYQRKLFDSFFTT